MTYHTDVLMVLLFAKLLSLLWLLQELADSFKISENLLHNAVTFSLLTVSEVSLNIFYCQNIYSIGVGSQVLTTLVSTLPLHSIYTQKLINMAIYTNVYDN